MAVRNHARYWLDNGEQFGVAQRHFDMWEGGDWWWTCSTCWAFIMIFFFFVFLIEQMSGVYTWEMHLTKIALNPRPIFLLDCNWKIVWWPYFKKCGPEPQRVPCGSPWGPQNNRHMIIVNSHNHTLQSLWLDLRTCNEGVSCQHVAQQGHLLGDHLHLHIWASCRWSAHDFTWSWAYCALLQASLKLSGVHTSCLLHSCAGGL